MFSTVPNCHTRGRDITRDSNPLDSVQFRFNPAKQLMYNPYYNQQYELTLSTGQPGIGVEPSDAPSNQDAQKHAAYSSNMPVQAIPSGQPLDFLSVAELRGMEMSDSFQYFDYGLSTLPPLQQFPSSPSSWSTSSPHTSLTPLLDAASLSASSDRSLPFSSHVPSTPSPYHPSSCLFAPNPSPSTFALNPSPSTFDHLLLSPTYGTQELSPAYYTSPLTPPQNQMGLYFGASSPGSQQGSSPSSQTDDGSCADDIHRLVTPPRLRVPQQIEAKSDDGFKVDFTIDGAPGIRLKDAVKCIDEIGLDGAFDKVFRSKGARQIRLVLTWPGYPQTGIYIPVQDKNGHLTRAQFANLVGIRLEALFKQLSKREIAPGHAPWKIHRAGITFDNLWLVSVKAAAANMWVAELEVDTA